MSHGRHQDHMNSQSGRSLTSHAPHATSSRIPSNHGSSQPTGAIRSDSSFNRYSENKSQSSNIRNSGSRGNFNEQTRNSTANNIDHRVYRKRTSTTFNTTSDSPPIKRPCLPPVSYSTLTELLNKSSDEILIEMVNPNFQLNKFLNDKRMQERYDWILTMTILIEKITKSIESHEKILSILEELPNTCYLEGVYDEIRKFDPDTNQLRFELIELFLKISNTFLAMIPHSSDDLRKIFDYIELQFIKNKSQSYEFEHTNKILNEVLERVKEIEKQKQQSLNTKILNHINQPFGDYRQLPIVPHVIEILSDQRICLRKNIIDGIYENAEEYLDIHFRLLREDFIGPLRDGIQQYISKIPGKNFNIRIYENVHLKGSRLTSRGELLYDLILDRKVASNIFWANSRRLIYGNLLVLTYDNFQSCVFVTVEDRSQIDKTFTLSVKKLENLNNSDQIEINLDHIDPSSSLIMIETMTYFEAYRPVLNALQMIPTDYRFPLAPFILKLKNEITSPDYITSTTTYDFTPLLVDPYSDVQAKLTINYQTLSIGSKRHRRLIKQIHSRKFQIDYKQSNQIDEKYKKILILNKDEWPTSEQLHLNPKQHQALILALTNKVALIQGPPGTGKTYLGVRITEMLLYNQSVWCPSNQPSTPILMICHTNHALDQFLELIVKRLNINDGIIRVGSRCENSTIQNFSLFYARQRAREYRSIPSDIYYQKHILLGKKTEAEQILKLQQHKLNISQTNIISLSVFNEYSIIDQRHYKSLVEPYDDQMLTRSLLEWLDIAHEYEQIDNDFNYGENIENKQDIIYEEEKEEERRRDEIDMEEYDHFSPSTTRKPNTIKENLIDIELLSNTKSNSRRNRQTIEEKSNHNQRTIQFIVQHPTTINDVTIKQVNDDVWRLSMVERYDLYRYWLLKYQQYLHQSAHDAREEYHKAVSDLAKYRQEEDYHILKDSIIIAMTTTCAAKYHQVLEKLQSKIVIVEEAAAIFEAHIITALSTKCEHLILIGDHVQLRPNPSVYHLGIKYNIDVSLFERLIKNHFPNVRLNIQHRMRPEIARLMKHFYDDLIDDISVINDRPPIRGINSNIFFINHNSLETTIDDGSSKRNEFESEYILQLTKYLIKQGYQSKQITILVMYLGQRQFIAKQAKEMTFLHGVKIMVTDNYQGEENDIIILSLVRSNPEKKIGFLKIHNRICVALSRARCGLFVIGNMNLLAEVDDTWKQIVTSLTETNHIGKGLSLSCRQHPEPKFLADKPESFLQRPEGGCRKRCDARLKCGHQCELTCHNYDLEHQHVACYKECNEQLPCGHSCKKQCHIGTPNQHGECRVSVEKIIPKCGHQILIRCCETLNLFKQCSVLVEKTIPECDHQIVTKCCEMPTVINCKKTSLKQLPCNHFVEVPCRIILSADKLKEFDCPKACNTILACQHKCIGTCGNCRTGKLHVPCDEKCDRELICSHVCKAPCASNCPPCTRECQIRCTHSRCKKTCGDLCIPCREPCDYKCQHLQCTRLCSEPCNRDPCNKPCNERLKCGHTCIGMCGELCPRLCRICDKHIVEDFLFGTEDEPNARFVFLPDCKHIIEINALDQYIKDFVNISNDNKIAIRFPECPRCRQKIYRCTRYTTIINEIHKLINQVKKKILGNQTEQEINNRRKQLRIEYEKFQKNSKEIFFDKSMHDYFSILYRKNSFFTDDMLNLINNIILFLNEIDQLLDDGRKKLARNIFEDTVNLPLNHILKYLFKQRHYRNFAEQQLNDIQLEFQRIRRGIYIGTWILSLQQILKDNEKEGIDTMQYLTNKPGPFTKEDQDKFDDLVQKFEYLNHLPGLGITENERKAIVSALNMKKGHWYICPNRHPYVITECGGASQESQCPDCGEQIGGQNHRLLETNHHFSLMDDSQSAAWSNEANLNGPH